MPPELEKLEKGFGDFKTKHEAELKAISDKLDAIEAKAGNEDFNDDVKKRYSIKNVIRSLSGGNVDIGFEKEISQEITTKTGRQPTQGLLMPIGCIEQKIEQKALTVGTEGELVQSTIRGDSFIDALRNKSVVMNLNPMILPNLIGDISIPKQSGASTAYWLDSDHADAITESTQTFDEVTLTPKTVGALSKISHKMLIQNDIGIENLIRSDLAATIATAIDDATINGTGSTNQPTGILATSGIGSGTYAVTVPTRAEMLDLELSLEIANTLSADTVYLVDPTIKSALKQVDQSTAGNGMFVWQDDQVEGHKAISTNVMPAATILMGDFTQLIIGLWGAVEIAADMYSDFAKGTVSLRILADIDLAVRHAAAFEERTLAP